MGKPLEAVATEGSVIRLKDGRELIDGVASWWTACHGYNHPIILEAVARQLAVMPHIMLGGLVHEQATHLASRLARLGPCKGGQVFFSESGSVAVEVALKMAVQFFENKGQPQKKKFVSLRYGYHGDTLGCMAVSDPECGFSSKFAGYHVPPILADIQWELPRNLEQQKAGDKAGDKGEQEVGRGIGQNPKQYAPQKAPQKAVSNLAGPEASGQAAGCSALAQGSSAHVDWLKNFEALLDQHCSQLCGVIVEPLVQGAGGMKFYSPFVLKQLADAVQKRGLLLIVDEIFTGFGRTGLFFASEAADIAPDIVCVGKALTGGVVALAATIAAPHVFEAFWTDRAEDAFMHGPTYMGNPLAAAAANASLDLFESEPRLAQVALIEKQLVQELEACRGLPVVRDVRVKGAIGVVQCVEGFEPKTLREQFVEKGLWIRPFGNIIYLTPSFTIEPCKLSALTQGIYDCLGNCVVSICP